MIKFGSQVTLRLPVGATVLVAAGERVEAGTTVIALLGGGSGA
jgi:phosphatidylserine decarboxylase